MNKLLFLFFAFLLLFGTFSAHAQTSLTAYFFYGEGCPHCAKERAIKASYPNLEIKSFEIYYNSSNALLLQKTAQALSVNIGGVPFLVIGDKYFIGYADNLTSSEIKNRIEECLSNGCPDSIAKILDVNIEEKKDITQEIEKIPLTTDTVEKQNQISSKEKIIDLPIFGNVNIYKFSLPVITIVLGFLDGFNPCAMWVLLFLVSLLFGMKNKKKLWLFGSVFLIASAIVYFLFMTA